MRIGIIGAGISGLSAALALTRQGHHVEVFEQEPAPGGLISTFDFDGVRIERYYHFLCKNDEGYFELARRLGLADRLRWVKARTGFYYEGVEYPFSTPLDLLRFRPIPLAQRVRFGLFALEARMRREWRQLDDLTAKPWLIDRIGRRAYEVIWHPLLALKFGELHNTISAAWVWHRLHRVARSKGYLGYLDGGTQLLLDALVRQVRAQGGAIHENRPVAGIVEDGGRVAGVTLADGEAYTCDHVVSTTSLSVLARLLPSDRSECSDQLRKIQYIGIVCVILKLKRPVSRYFWLNVNDTAIPFNGIIEYTNLNPLGDRQQHIVYVPYYVPVEHPLYQADDASVVAQSWDAVKRISGRLTDADLLASRAFRSPFAQAICPTGFLGALAGTALPIRGLHLLDSAFIYPEDRTQAGLAARAFACADGIRG